MPQPHSSHGNKYKHQHLTAGDRIAVDAAGTAVRYGFPHARMDRQAALGTAEHARGHALIACWAFERACNPRSYRHARYRNALPWDVSTYCTRHSSGTRALLQKMGQAIHTWTHAPPRAAPHPAGCGPRCPRVRRHHWHPLAASRDVVLSWWEGRDWVSGTQTNTMSSKHEHIKAMKHSQKGPVKCIPP